MSKHRDRRRPLHKYKSFVIPLTLRCRRVWSSNLSTQLRRTQGLNTESLTMPATVADPNRSLDSEQISPATIAHHTVYEKTPNLHQSHICQWGAQSYLVGPLSRLVGKPPLSSWMSTNVLPLTQAGNNTNSAISLTEIFDRVFSDVCNSLGFEVQKQKNGDRGTIVFTATLRRGNIFTLQCVTLIYTHILFLLYLSVLPRKCTTVVQKITRDVFWCDLILHLDTAIQQVVFPLRVS